MKITPTTPGQTRDNIYPPESTGSGKACRDEICRDEICRGRTQSSLDALDDLETGMRLDTGKLGTGMRSTRHSQKRTTNFPHTGLKRPVLCPQLNLGVAAAAGPRSSPVYCLNCGRVPISLPNLIPGCDTPPRFGASAHR